MDKPSDKYKYRMEIQQMMFVSGETHDPAPETLALIEDIVRSQVVEILHQASALARKRSARNIAVEDLIFLFRHDRAKVNRLSTYLSWKDLRKNARDQDGGAVDGADVIEDPNMMNSESAKKIYKSAKIRLPWELTFMFSEQPLDDDDDEEEEDEYEREANMETFQRLKAADERTRGMTKEEYVHWSECRQATFTFKKAKRFREWAGILHLTDSKPHDDVMDILGFLTFEIVANLTEEALKIKAVEEKVDLKSHKAKKRKRDHHLFDGPDDDNSPLQIRHIQEAYRRFQQLTPKSRSLRCFTGGLVSRKVQVI